MRFIQRAIPIAGQHAAAYLDLAQQDLEIAKHNAIASLIRGVVLVVSAVFALFCLCVLLIALAWDSDYRILSIGTMTLAFVLIAVISMVQLRRKRPKLFASLRVEWQADRALFQTMIQHSRAEQIEPDNRLAEAKAYAEWVKDVTAQKRVAESREQLQELLTETEQERTAPTHFPRSKTMCMLTTGKGVALLALVAGGAIVQPRLLKTILRVAPVSAFLKAATTRFLAHDR